MRRERERAEQRRARLITSAVVGVVLVIVVVAVIAVRSASSGPTGSNPAGITAENGFTYTAANASPSPSPTPSGGVAPVPVVLYEDYQCPTCKAFEQSSGSYLEQQVTEGAVTIEYRPIAILDRMSSTSYSTRSANATACVYEDAGAATYVKFHDLLYANQPAEGSSGLTDDQLTQLSVQAGASDSVSACISNQRYKDWVTQATDAASKAGVTGTPTVLVDGQPVNGSTGGNSSPSQQDMMAAITAARGSGTPNPSSGTP